MKDARDQILNSPKNGDLPRAWSATTLGDVTTLQRGKDLPVGQRRVGPYPVVGSNGVVGWHEEFVAQGPGVLVGRSGSVGEVSWIETDYWPLNTALWVKDFHGNDPEFTYYLLRSLNLSFVASGVSVPTLNRNLVHPLHVAIPPLAEQRAIARVLRTVQEARRATEKVIAATRNLKQSVMCHLFTYGPIPFDNADSVELKDTVIGPIPANWELEPFEHLFESRLGKMLSGAARTGKSSRPHLRNANVQWGKLDLRELYEMDFDESERAKFRLRHGDVLICEGGEVGRTAIWRDELGECFYQKAIHCARPRDERMIPEFLMYHLMNAFLIRNTYGMVGTVTTIAHLPGI